MKRISKITLFLVFVLLFAFSLFNILEVLSDILSHGNPQKYFHFGRMVIYIPVFFLSLLYILIIFKRTRNGQIINISITLTTLVLLFFLLEVLSIFLHPPVHVEREREFSELPNNMDIVMTKYLFPDSAITQSSTHDSIGRRYVDANLTSNSSAESDTNIILFGDSFTYGYAINDTDTLQFHLMNKSGYDVYNYAKPGRGPQNMLYNLQYNRSPDDTFIGEDIFHDIDPEERNIGIFQILPSVMTARASGKPVSDIRRIDNDPMYIINEDGLIHNGTFFESSDDLVDFRRIKSIIYANYYMLRSRSNLLKVLTPDHLGDLNQADRLLTLEIIKESRRIFEKNFNGEFYVLMSPKFEDFELSDDLKKNLYVSEREFELLRDSVRFYETLFIDNGIPYLSYDFVDNNHDYMVSEYIFHPNGRHNEKLASLLLEDI